MADIRCLMPMTLAAGGEGFFTVMGFPRLWLRQSAVAMEKWKLLLISHCLILLGFLFNTQKMTIGITDEFCRDVLHLLDTTWHCERQAFTAKEIEMLVGKLNHIGQAYWPLYHLMPHLYASLAYALRNNEDFLITSIRRFRKMVKAAKKEFTMADDQCEINVAIAGIAKMTHSTNVKYRMPERLEKEL